MAKIDVRRVLDLISPASRTEEAGGVTPLLQAHLDDIAMSGGSGTTTHESWKKCAAH